MRRLTTLSPYRRHWVVLMLVLNLVVAACSSSDSDKSPADDDDPADYVINAENYAELIGYVFTVYVGDVYNRRLLNAHSFLFDNTPTSSTLDDDTLVRQQLFDCKAGGSAITSQTEYFNWKQSIYPSPHYFDFDFTVCEHDDLSYDGSIEYVDFGGLRITSPGIEVAQKQAGVLKFTGEAMRTTPEHDFDNLPRHVWSTSNATVFSTDASGVALSLTDANSYFESGFELGAGGLAYLADLSGGFAMSSGVTQDHIINVSVPEPLSYRSEQLRYREAPVDWYFAEGRLLLEADDGSALELDAQLTDASTARITLHNGDAVQILFEPWRRWRDQLQFASVMQSESDPDPDHDAGLVVGGELPADASTNPSVIHRDNYARTLGQVLKVYTGSIYPDALNSLRSQPMEDSSSTFRVIPDDHLNKTFLITEYSCPNGSGARVVGNRTSHYGDRSYTHRDFDRYDCQSTGYSFDGHAEFRDWSGGGETLAADGLSIVDPQGHRTQFGGWTQSRAFGKGTGYYVRRSKNLSLSVTAPEEGEQDNAFSLWDGNTAFGSGSYSSGLYRFVAHLDGSFSIQAPWTQWQTVVSEALEGFSFTKSYAYDETEGEYYAEGDSYPTAGRLRLTAEDGSVLLLVVDSDDPGMIAITITDHMGTTEFTVDWLQWARIIDPHGG